MRGVFGVLDEGGNIELPDEPGISLEGRLVGVGISSSP